MSAGSATCSWPQRSATDEPLLNLLTLQVTQLASPEQGNDVCPAETLSLDPGVLITIDERIDQPVLDSVCHGVAVSLDEYAVLLVTEYLPQLLLGLSLGLASTLARNPLPARIKPNGHLSDPALSSRRPVKAALSTSS